MIVCYCTCVTEQAIDNHLYECYNVWLQLPPYSCMVCLHVGYQQESATESNAVDDTTTITHQPPQSG